MQQSKTIFQLSRAGNRAAAFPKCDVPEQPLDKLFPYNQLAAASPPLPELSEVDVVRHYTRLADKNMSVDANFYPLGSCTMKYNPKRNERLAALSCFTGLHPNQPADTVQGQLRILYELQQMLAEISGLPAVSLQPAAGAHGELTSLLIAGKFLTEKFGVGKKTTVLIPDCAHGTNPASAAVAGFKTVEVKSTAAGQTDLDDLRSKLNDTVAVLMITNPNTLGLFEKNIKEICEMVHAVGGLVYNDGANMNAICGIVRPGDFGADMMHFNVHKTFSTPHGGGGPGAGPIAVKQELAPYLPIPLVGKTKGGKYVLTTDCPKTIGKVRTFAGSIGVLNRAYFYLRTLGAKGLKEMSENAVLNANYLLALLKDYIEVPAGERCMHEFVASANKLKTDKGITTMDIAKRLIDYGYHPPTIYFPLIVKEAIMIEPTETETKETLDTFAKTLIEILTEDQATLHDSPQTTKISRPNEVTAAKTPVLAEK
ncbi:MAG: aminomethyl-transferring glycine dehydrogenase subunit GcvPB [Planctomycetaceae bacterium]|jgi:glycine dehydrogenase subunit 2|nr:aminomethyl-transferring glycine dehydrogenase subunit GcvPB [Planctomycetaceae bacterium]